MYESAFQEQMKMLRGEKPISFKRAVFLYENAYRNGTLDYDNYCDEIKLICKKLRILINQRGLTRYKTSGNWAAYAFIHDSLSINNFKPYTYDFEDFSGDKDYSKMFVTKLMKEKNGNCTSLPSFYKILCEEIGVKAYLAIAPNHMYVKHKDEEDKWINLELTNGGFPRDQWIIQQLAIGVEAIRNGVYMRPLTEKEDIAMTIYHLASAYQHQYGYDEFVLRVVKNALYYFPTCLPLLMKKADCYLFYGKTELEKGNPNKSFLRENYKRYKAVVSTIESLGYKDMPKEQYDDWVKSVEQEKKRRGLIK